MSSLTMVSVRRSPQPLPGSPLVTVPSPPSPPHPRQTLKRQHESHLQTFWGRIKYPFHFSHLAEVYYSLVLTHMQGNA